MALVLISHDLGVVAETCDRVCVMYAGRVVEATSTASLFGRPAPPLRVGLLGALPPIDGPRRPLAAIPAACRSPGPCRRLPLRAALPAPPRGPATPRRLRSPRGPGHRAALHPAVEPRARRGFGSGDGVTASPTPDGDRCSMPKNLVRRYTMRRGLLGERGGAGGGRGVAHPATAAAPSGWWAKSGCGKSTTGRLVLGLEAPDAAPSPSRDGRCRRPGTRTGAGAARAHADGVFHDPLGALDRRLLIVAQVAEPLDIHASAAVRERARPRGGAAEGGGPPPRSGCALPA
jgi:ABC-type glutathione transport system ATPase component